ncbi:hypothetical protein [Psychromarinibacter sp. S121]|uniref:hypothetical protein n=1 Tax=Psychromarinibacter sp. S121 TaxID=3415127 RepID=UPI003C7994F3
MRDDAGKKVKVGSGITKRERTPYIGDDPYREKAISGALLPSGMRVSPAEPLEDFEGRVSAYCRDTFAEADLPDPFSFIHPGGKFRPMDYDEVLPKGDAYLKSRMDMGYFLTAHLFCPAEDHSALWYAARLAAELTRLHVLLAKLDAGLKDKAQGALEAAAVGLELGRLDGERRLKFEHESDALRGKKDLRDRRSGAAATNSAKRGDTQKTLAAMKKIMPSVGNNVSRAAKSALRQGFGTSVAGNRGIWYRSAR